MIRLMTTTQRKLLNKTAQILVSMLLFLSYSTLSTAQQQTISINDPNHSDKILKRTIPSHLEASARQMRSFHLNPVLQSIDAIHVGDVITLELFASQQYRAHVDKVFEDVNNTLIVRARNMASASLPLPMV